MSDTQTISIPETCDQSWGQMTVVSGGRYCGQCSKTVIDFTQMSDVMIIRYLSAGDHICGRIGQFQMNRLSTLLADKPKRYFNWNWLVTTVSIVGLLTFSKAQAKVKSVFTTEQAPVKKQDSTNTDTVFKMIRGKVSISGKRSKSMINIRVKGTDIVAVTDKNGRFEMSVPLTARILELTTQPFVQLEDIDPQNKTFYHIKLSTKIKPGVTNSSNYDRVVMGGLRVKPGQKFNKELLIRSARELGLLEEPVELPVPLVMPERGKI